MIHREDKILDKLAKSVGVEDQVFETLKAVPSSFGSNVEVLELLGTLLQDPEFSPRAVFGEKHDIIYGLLQANLFNMNLTFQSRIQIANFAHAMHPGSLEIHLLAHFDERVRGHLAAGVLSTLLRSPKSDGLFTSADDFLRNCTSGQAERMESLSNEDNSIRDSAYNTLMNQALFAKLSDSKASQEFLEELLIVPNVEIRYRVIEFLGEKQPIALLSLVPLSAIYQTVDEGLGESSIEMCQTILETSRRICDSFIALPAEQRSMLVDGETLIRLAECVSQVGWLGIADKLGRV